MWTSLRDVKALYQVAFLVEGNLLPRTLERLQVGDHLLFEHAWSKRGPLSPTGQNQNYSFAFLATHEETNFFQFAAEYLDFFLLVYALRSGQPAVQFMGIGTDLSDLDSLGKIRSSFSDFERLEVLHPDPNSVYSRPILSAKETFLSLESNRETIMKGYLGLALRFFYSALQAYQKGRLDETVIDLAVAAEAMVSTGPKYEAKLKGRISTLIGETESERMGIVSKLADFYQTRSLFMHGEGGSPALADVSVYVDYVRSAIEKCLANRLFAKSELIARLDSSQIPHKSPTEIQR